MYLIVLFGTRITSHERAEQVRALCLVAGHSTRRRGVMESDTNERRGHELGLLLSSQATRAALGP